MFFRKFSGFLLLCNLFCTGCDFNETKSINPYIQEIQPSSFEPYLKGQINLAVSKGISQIFPGCNIQNFEVSRYYAWEKFTDIMKNNYDINISVDDYTFYCVYGSFTVDNLRYRGMFLVPYHKHAKIIIVETMYFTSSPKAPSPILFYDAAHTAYLIASSPHDKNEKIDLRTMSRPKLIGNGPIFIENIKENPDHSYLDRWRLYTPSGREKVLVLTVPDSQGGNYFLISKDN